MSYELWILEPDARVTGGLTARRSTVETAQLPPSSGRAFVMLGGGDDHLLWRANDGVKERGGLSEGADDAFREALGSWLLRTGIQWNELALKEMFSVPSGGAELAGLVVTALGADVPDARPRFGEWLGDAPVRRVAGETLVDWRAQRWQFGMLKGGGYGVWDSLAPGAPVRRILSQFPEVELDDATWELVLDPIVRATHLDADVYGCRVTPRPYLGFPLPPGAENEPAALLIHFDSARGMMSSFTCGSRIETRDHCAIGTQLLVSEPDPATGADRYVGVRVSDLSTFQRSVAAGCVQQSAWVKHPPGGDRSLPALAAWASSLGQH